MFRNLAEPRNILAEPLGSAEPRLKNTVIDNNNNNNLYFKSLSYTNVLFKLEMNAQQNKLF